MSTTRSDFEQARKNMRGKLGVRQWAGAVVEAVPEGEDIVAMARGRAAGSTSCLLVVTTRRLFRFVFATEIPQIEVVDFDKIVRVRWTSRRVATQLDVYHDGVTQTTDRMFKQDGYRVASRLQESIPMRRS